MTVDLEAISAEFLKQCGYCDAGVSFTCTCSGRDFRPTMLELVREVKDLRAEVAELNKMVVTYRLTSTDEE